MYHVEHKKEKELCPFARASLSPSLSAQSALNTHAESSEQASFVRSRCREKRRICATTIQGGTARLRVIPNLEGIARLEF